MIDEDERENPGYKNPHLQELNNLPRDERRECIRKALETNATEISDDYPDKTPLFERDRIKNSPELQQQVLRLAEEYVDITLFNQANIDFIAGQKMTRSKKLAYRAHTEIVTWQAHAKKVLDGFTDPDGRAFCMVDSVIGLAARSVGSLLNLPVRQHVGIISGGNMGLAPWFYLEANTLDSADPDKMSMADRIIQEDLDALNNKKPPSR